MRMWILYLLISLLTVTICGVVYIFSIINHKFAYFNERAIQKRRFMEWLLQLVMPYLLLPVFLFFHTQLVGEELLKGEKIFYGVVMCFFGILTINSISKTFIIWKQIKNIRTRRVAV